MSPRLRSTCFAPLAFAAFACAIACNDFRAGPPEIERADASDAAPDDRPSAFAGKLRGGPCASGAPGATGFRMSFVAGRSRAEAKLEELGLPDDVGFGVNVRAIDGSAAPFGDSRGGPGGALVGASAYVDVDLSTRGLGKLRGATLSILGRSDDADEGASFSWQTDHGTSKLDAGSIGNGLPYRWVSANVTAELPLDEGGVRIRIRPGPPSLALVVRRIELCLDVAE